MFRPFPEAALRDACQSATHVAVLDRNYAAGVGGVFWQDTRAAFQGHRDNVLVQNYLAGLCGGDVTPDVIDDILTDLVSRSEAGDPVWMGIETGEETLQ
jgi:pyruvate ferredoxin oxidoreductase alpha subunit